ncbi:FAD:protein FMN transferase [Microbacterium sp. bgisy203]|uniref:FAD:protein FMN transferase n=1 Tax=Microbacterium sp. bgisy203 TaxID=3413799 RepID=UPI003D711F75
MAGARPAPAAASPAVATHAFDAIGTRWRIDTERPLDEAIVARIDDVVERFDREWSRFRVDSVVSDLADRAAIAPATVPAPRDAAAMLDLYAALSEATTGAVNPLVGDALARRGYDPASSLVDCGAEPAPARWRELLGWDGDRLRLAEPATIDVGALGKGRLVDLVGAVLAEASLSRFTVDASGDLLLRGGGAGGAVDPGERIALEHPFDPSRAIGVWTLAEGALCASAVGRRAWPGADGGGLHHVLDARTGEPVRTIAATWATAPDTMTADAAATALFFAGGERFAAAHGVEWVRMATSGRVEWSPGCGAELFT